MVDKAHKLLDFIKNADNQDGETNDKRKDLLEGLNIEDITKKIYKE